MLCLLPCLFGGLVEAQCQKLCNRKSSMPVPQGGLERSSDALKRSACIRENVAMLKLRTLASCGAPPLHLASLALAEAVLESVESSP